MISEFRKDSKFFFQNFLISVFIVIALVILGIQTLHYLSRVSVLALKISNILPAWVVWNWNSHLLSCCFLMVFFFIPFSFVEVCVWFCALSFQLLLLWVGRVLIFFLNRLVSRKLIETNFWQEKLFFRLP